MDRRRERWHPRLRVSIQCTGTYVPLHSFSSVIRFLYGYHDCFSSSMPREGGLSLIYRTKLLVFYVLITFISSFNLSFLLFIHLSICPCFSTPLHLAVTYSCDLATPLFSPFLCFLLLLILLISYHTSFLPINSLYLLWHYQTLSRVWNKRTQGWLERCRTYHMHSLPWSTVLHCSALYCTVLCRTTARYYHANQWPYIISHNIEVKQLQIQCSYPSPPLLLFLLFPPLSTLLIIITSTHTASLMCAGTRTYVRVDLWSPRTSSLLSGTDCILDSSSSSCLFHSWLTLNDSSR